jgi:hypothetical protein
MKRTAIGVALMALLAGTLAVAIPRLRPGSEVQAAAAQVAKPVVYSNVSKADYVGPELCGSCHSRKYRLWRSHPHSRMNQDAAGNVLGDFSNQKLQYAGAETTFAQEDGAFTMATQWAAGGRRRFRVTRTVGSRQVQMYIGVQVEGPEAAGHPVYSTEVKLPFGYWLHRRTWAPDFYFDSDNPSEETAIREFSYHGRAYAYPWQQSCILCHNTYPYELRPEQLRGFPRQRFDQVSPGTLQLAPEQLVTLGISCESCHFGGRAHALEGRPIQFVPHGAQVRLAAMTRAGVASAREDRETIVSICAQCHVADVSTHPNGAGVWNSREALDLRASKCQAKCTDCHDPHQPGPGRSGGTDDPDHVAACTTCHAQFGTTAARNAHAQHPAGVSCLDCHMPRIVQGLESAIRTHLIGTPADESMLALGAPNACNLCHLDKPISWTARELRERWQSTVTPVPAWAFGYPGGLDRPVGLAWLESDRPEVRLVAAQAYGLSRSKDALPALMPGLDDPVAVNRMFTLFAVEALLGRPLTEEEYSPMAPRKFRRGQITELVRKLPR